MAYDSHDHGVYTRRYFCASNSSVSKRITLDSDLRPMIMNYHEIITVFASCRVGLTLPCASFGGKKIGIDHAQVLLISIN